MDNTQAIESFIDRCDELMLPATEGVGSMVKSLFDRVVRLLNRIVNFIRTKFAKKEDIYVNHDVYTDIWADIKTYSAKTKPDFSITDRIYKLEEKLKKMTIADKKSRLYCIKGSEVDMVLKNIKSGLEWNKNKLEKLLSTNLNAAFMGKSASVGNARLSYMGSIEMSLASESINIFATLERMAEAIVNNSITKRFSTI